MHRREERNIAVHLDVDPFLDLLVLSITCDDDRNTRVSFSLSSDKEAQREEYYREDIF
jgi:hypothetical protein